ncbi:calcium-binding protein [Phaeobacter marinintestinus]|uniref:calcium-binding protein n=1 Tax=Falsiphaeobacter marinintestinus TaxID=1492905 RepID=UPI0011B54C85|nr:calcium-binding protein [Phaeobacter marinintestinus]
MTSFNTTGKFKNESTFIAETAAIFSTFVTYAEGASAIFDSINKGIETAKSLFDIIDDLFSGDTDPRAWATISIGANGFFMDPVVRQLDGGKVIETEEHAAQVVSTLNDIISGVGMDLNSINFRDNIEFFHVAHFEDNYFLITDYLVLPSGVQDGIFTNLQNSGVAYGTKEYSDSFFGKMLIKILQQVDFSAAGLTDVEVAYIATNLQYALGSANPVEALKGVMSYSEELGLEIYPNTTFGTAASDTLSGDSKFFASGEGADTINANSRDNIIDAGDGDDFIYAQSGNDLVQGGIGSDRIWGGAGNDLIYGSSIALNGQSDVVDGDDRIFGGRGNDEIYGNQSNDIISGGVGDDLLFGGRGNDRVVGGPGSDQLFGNGGSDRLIGGSGDDEFYIDVAVSDMDRVADRSGNDVLFLQGGATVENTQVQHGRRTTTILVNGEAEVVIVNNGAFNPVVEQISFESGDYILL